MSVQQEEQSLEERVTEELLAMLGEGSGDRNDDEREQGHGKQRQRAGSDGSEGELEEARVKAARQAIRADKDKRKADKILKRYAKRAVGPATIELGGEPGDLEAATKAALAAQAERESAGGIPIKRRVHGGVRVGDPEKGGTVGGLRRGSEGELKEAHGAKKHKPNAAGSEDTEELEERRRTEDRLQGHPEAPNRKKVSEAEVVAALDRILAEQAEAPAADPFRTVSQPGEGPYDVPQTGQGTGEMEHPMGPGPAVRDGSIEPSRRPGGLGPGYAGMLQIAVDAAKKAILQGDLSGYGIGDPKPAQPM
jgi:hypothetical protein